MFVVCFRSFSVERAVSALPTSSESNTPPYEYSALLELLLVPEHSSRSTGSYTD